MPNMREMIGRARIAVEQYDQTPTEDSSPVSIFNELILIIEDRRPDTLNYDSKYKVMVGTKCVPMRFYGRAQVLTFLEMVMELLICDAPCKVKLIQDVPGEIEKFVLPGDENTYHVCGGGDDDLEVMVEDTKGKQKKLHWGTRVIVTEEAYPDE